MKRGQPKKKGQSRPSKEEIGELQEILLTAILSSQPLPGADKPINFPDLAMIVNQPNIILADENLVRSVQIKASPKPVQILSSDEMREQARTHGDLTYLHFQPPEVGDNSVGLTLEGRIMPRNPDQRTLGLSTIQIRFHKVGDQWLAQGDPVLSAS